MQPDAGHFPRAPRFSAGDASIAITGKWPDLNLVSRLINFTDTGSSTGTNATTAVSILSVIGPTANGGMVLAPKAQGPLMLTVPDGANPGGNARGLRAVDLSRNRSGPANVASGTDSFSAGTDNLVSGTGAAGIGTGLTVSNTSGFAAGASHANAAAYGTALGRAASNRAIVGTVVLSAGSVSTTGDRQTVIFQGKCQTVDAATPAVLTADNGAANATNTWVLANNSCHAFIAVLTGRRTTGDMAAWKIEGSVNRIATAGTTTVSAAAPVSLGNIGTGATTVFSVAANLVNGSIEFSVVGFAAATTGQWTLTVFGPETVG